MACLSEVGSEIQGKLLEKSTSLFPASAEDVEKHLKWCSTEVTSSFSFPNDDGVDWLNGHPDDIERTLTIVDFFTYCCANCLHLLPTLEEVHETFGDRVSIIGVHSAKFDNEKRSDSLRLALEKYKIRHPVLNDGEGKLWAETGMFCWPTLLVLDPSMKPILVLIGEKVKKELELFLSAALAFYGSERPLPRELRKAEVAKKNTLHFPGKIVSSAGRVFISDSANDRVLITDQNGIIEKIFDEEGSFSNPQGLCFVERRNFLFVADTGNHLIKKIDMNEGTIEAVKHDHLISPWDLCSGPVPNESVLKRLNLEKITQDELLYVACAGSHRILMVSIDGPGGFSEVLGVLAGSGEEEVRNNVYPDKAGFAQPSGICYSTETNCLYIADAESSAVREVSLSTGAVKSLAGASKDPKNLFVYGDVDADTGKDARFQHPLGVTWSYRRSFLVVADSYNHKIKICDVPTGKTLTVYQAEGNAEFGGICCDGEWIYVAETNQHRILRGRFVPGSSILDLKPFLVNKNIPDDRVWLPEKHLKLESTLGLNFDVLLERGVKLNEEAPQKLSYKVLVHGDVVAEHMEIFSPEKKYVVVGDCLPKGESKLLAEVRLVLCDDTGSMCFPAEVKFGVPISVGDYGEEDSCVVFQASVGKPF